MKKKQLTLREAAGLTIGFAGAMMMSVVDGSPREIGIRLAGAALMIAGAWIGKAFCWQHEAEREDDPDPYPEE